MKRKLSEVLAIICCMVLYAGCSVKEDRTACPCRILLDFSSVDTAAVTAVDMLVNASGGFVHKKCLHADEIDAIYTVSVPQGNVTVNVSTGADGMVYDDGSLVIPYGSECPEVYMHCSGFEAMGELYRHEVLLRKEHCILTVYVKADGAFPFNLSVKGHVNGFTPYGKPSEGDFMCAAGAESDGGFRAVIPRQLDSTLKLEVNDGSEMLKVFALGEYLEASGYDWDAVDLENVTVSLDYSLTRLTVYVEGWDHEYAYDVVI